MSSDLAHSIAEWHRSPDREGSFTRSLLHVAFIIIATSLPMRPSSTLTSRNDLMILWQCRRSMSRKYASCSLCPSDGVRCAHLSFD